MTISKKLMAGQERGLLVITGERPWCSVAKQPHVHLPRVWTKSHKRNVKAIAVDVDYAEIGTGRQIQNVDFCK